MKRSLGISGGRPNEMVRDNYISGSLGQFILTSIPFNMSMNRYDNPDRFGWPVDSLGTPDLDISDEDIAAAVGGIVTPHVGPPLTIVGTINEGIETPWEQDPSTNTTSSFFQNGAHLKNVNPFDPAINDDIVILVLCWISRATFFLLSNRLVDKGFYVINFSDTAFFKLQDNIGSSVQSGGPMSGGWNLIGVTAETGGSQKVFLNGVEIDSDSISTLSGDYQSSLGIWINAAATGINDSRTGHSRILLWYDPLAGTIADSSWHKLVADYVLGIRDVQDISSGPVFTRSTSAIKKVGTTYHILGLGASRSGSENGILSEKTSVNKVYNNSDPPNTTGWSSTGGVLSVVDDSTDLNSAGLREAGLNALQFVNASGSSQIAYSGDVTANTNPHSVSVFGRVTAGSGARIGLRDASSGIFQNLSSISDSYARTMAHGITPDDIDQVFAIEIDDGCTIRFEWGQLEEGARCTSPIINTATAAPAQRNADDLLTDEDPDDGSGSIEFTITPVDWSGSEDSGSVLFLSDSGDPAVWVETGTWRARIDGTTNLDSGIAPSDGVAHRVRLRWIQGEDQSMEVWSGTTLLSRVESVYDGTLYSSGYWKFLSGPSIYIKKFVAYRNGSG